MRQVGGEGPYPALGTQEPTQEGAPFTELACSGVFCFFSPLHPHMRGGVGLKIWEDGEPSFLLPTLTLLESLCAAPLGLLSSHSHGSCSSLWGP